MQSLHILITTALEFAVWDRHLEQIRQLAPGAVLQVKPRTEVTQEDVHAADVIWGWPKPELAADAPHLRWVHLASAGSDGWAGVRPALLLTKSSGVFGIPISEWVIGAMLTLTRNLHLYQNRQRERRWEPLLGGREVYGSTVGIVGLGDIGAEVAKRARGLGCRVIGARRTPGPTPEFIDEVMPVDDLLPETDFLVLALPNTPETQKLISAERLARLKKGAYLINVGRGSTVDEEAMIEALKSGHMAGAALDVMAVEPLPPESPLWGMEQVIICPHASGRSPETNADRRTAIFAENLRRFLAGEPLQNLVNREAGY